MRLPWLSGAVALILLGGLAWYLAPLKPGILALQLAFTPRAFGEIIHFWSLDNLARYRAHLPIDFVLIVAYSLFGVSGPLTAPLSRRSEFSNACVHQQRRGHLYESEVRCDESAGLGA